MDTCQSSLTKRSNRPAPAPAIAVRFPGPIQKHPPEPCPAPAARAGCPQRRRPAPYQWRGIIADGGVNHLPHHYRRAVIHISGVGKVKNHHPVVTNLRRNSIDQPPGRCHRKPPPQLHQPHPRRKGIIVIPTALGIAITDDAGASPRRRRGRPQKGTIQQRHRYPVVMFRHFLQARARHPRHNQPEAIAVTRLAFLTGWFNFRRHSGASRNLTFGQSSSPAKLPEKKRRRRPKLRHNSPPSPPAGPACGCEPYRPTAPASNGNHHPSAS